jgi:hypothetical protein
MNSCIYAGRVRHRRFTPVENHFAYELFMMYVDLAELPTLFRRSWLWSCDGYGLARFRRRDHHGPADQPLDESIRRLVAERTGRRPGGPIRLLTHFEYFGYRFNPVSFYYCFDPGGEQVETVIAEINNTPWGEQHCYVLPRDASSGDSPAALRFRFGKQFHISPFIGMDAQYDWRFTPPGQTLAIHMENLGGEGRFFDATMTLSRRAITPAALRWVLIRYPLMTARVIAAIYYQALRLRLKGSPYHPHPKILAQPEVRP